MMTTTTAVIDLMTIAVVVGIAAVAVGGGDAVSSLGLLVVNLH